MNERLIEGARIPVSTYRLQFDQGFGFKGARDIVLYLRNLGISDIYSSPYFKTRKGSSSGYDIVDQNALNPELGTEEEFDELISELKEHGMGQILDIVPNHMCIESQENLRWMDVLENGPSSIYSEFFDIDWEPVDAGMRYKVLLPCLAGPYGKALESREIRLSFRDGAFYLVYVENVFPVTPKTYSSILEHRLDSLKERMPPAGAEYQELLSIITGLRYLPSYVESGSDRVAERYRENEVLKRRLGALCKNCHEIRIFVEENVDIFNGIPNKPESFDLLDRLLRDQIYRLAFWQVAADEINYRRFFDINSLAAIRMEDPGVFRDTHELILRLVREGSVTGLRIDHADGLYNPSEYLRRLQRECSSQLGLGPGEDEPYPEVFRPFYIVVEKILTKGEELPQDWPVFGETGYNFLNSVNGLFVKAENARLFDSIYGRFAMADGNFQAKVYEKKKLIMQTSLSGEMNTLGRRLHNISQRTRHARDFTLSSLTKAVIEVVACFPVYRSYINSTDIQDRDRHYIELALSKAKRRIPDIDESVFDFLKGILLLKFPEDLGDEDRERWLNFVMKLQQLSGPVMAKGVEDTAFYSYNRLISLNEVGGSPERFGTPLEAFHGQNIERSRALRHTMNTTSTHDTKRGEDARARINVLSEMPVQWKEHLVGWRRHSRRLKKIVGSDLVPDSNDEYMLYQTLIGSWPLGEMDSEEYEIFKGRIMDHSIKAAREAKVNTSWMSPNGAYEEGLLSLISALLERRPGNHFLNDFINFQLDISRFGMYNSLSQTLLKMTVPGIPDFYQGSELWDFSLVDPDNRRPVDYAARKNILEWIIKREAGDGTSETVSYLMGNWYDGAIKMFLIYKTLKYREANRQIFEKGDYLPLEAKGPKAANACAFAWEFESSSIIVAVPRFFTELAPEKVQKPLGEEAWADTRLVIPFDSARYRNIFTSEVIEAGKIGDQSGLRMSDIFRDFPVALLANV